MAMSKHHIDILQVNHMKLMNIHDIKSVIGHLIASQTITSNMEEELLAKIDNRRDVIYDLLTLLPRRGDKAFNQFYEALVQSNEDVAAGILKPHIDNHPVPPDYEDMQTDSMTCDGNTEEDAVPDRSDPEPNLMICTPTANTTTTTGATATINLLPGSTSIQIFNKGDGDKLADTLQVGHTNTMYFNSTDKDDNPKKAAKQTLTENTTEPDRDLLLGISNELTQSQAVMLGRQLGLTDSKIDAIKRDFNADGTAEIKYRILDAWIKVHSEPTIAMLAKCLNDQHVGRGDLADKLPR